MDPVFTHASRSEGSPGGHAKANRRAPRWGRLVFTGGVVIGGAAAIALAASTILSRDSPKPPLSAVFPSAAAIRELQWMAKDSPKDPEWQARLGMTHLADGHYLAAVEALQRALVLSAPQGPIRRALATCYSNLERHDEALAEHKKLAQINPTELWPQLSIARSYAALDQRGKALELLDSLPRDPDGLPTLRDQEGPLAAAELLAAEYGRLGRWQQALEIGRKVLHKDAARLGGKLAVARALVNLKRPAEAAEIIDSGLGPAEQVPEIQYLSAIVLTARGRKSDQARIVKLLEAGARSGQAAGDAYFRLGEIYERSRQWDKASEAYSMASKVRTRSVESLRRAAACYEKDGQHEEALYKRGLYFETLQRFPEAMLQYRELTRLHDCCASGYIHIAKARSTMGDKTGAVEIIEAALKRPHPNAKLYFEAARAYAAVQNFPKQTAMWHAYMKEAPDQADLGYHSLGQIADVGGKMDEAEKQYRKSVEMRPDADLYRLRLAKLLLQRRSDPKRLAEAIEHLEAAVKIGPENPEGFFQLGVAYRYAGRNEEAIAALRHAVDLDPGDGKTYQPLGEVLLATGRQEEGKRTLAMFRRFREFFQAWETLKARTTRSPNDVAAFRQLAGFYDRSGATFDAVKAYAHVLGLDPTDKKSERRLAELYRQMGQGDEDLSQVGIDPHEHTPRGGGGAGG